MSQPALTSEKVIVPNVEELVIEDDIPVDNFQSAKQQRLLVEPLYSSNVIPRPFVADANVGVFYTAKQPPIVPDCFLSLGVEMPADWSQKQNRTYLLWEFGKVPEVCIEIVSNQEGGELGKKKEIYAQIGVAYYVVFDPLKQIQDAAQMDGEILRIWGLTVGRYQELEPPFWLETVGLGLTLWEGTFEDQEGNWLRWFDQSGQLIPTGKERADRLAEKLRELGIGPNQL